MRDQYESQEPIAIVSPPIEGGVWDYAGILSKAAGARFVAFDSSVSQDGVGSPMPDLGCTLYIQVSPYGYQKRGVPMHLLRWARERKRLGFKVGFFFHELFAFGPPWRSSFWLSPLQRHIVREMARLADFWVTYGHEPAQWLLRAGGRKPHAILPVFSNMGEVPRLEALRTKSLAVCGSPGIRERTYRLAGSGLFEWAARLDLEIHDIGSPLSSDVRDRLARNGVREHGKLARNDASRLLSQATYGLLAYPVPYIAKSGVFAAYCAHGTCPLLISKSQNSLDGVVRGTHYRSWQPDKVDPQIDASLVGHRAFEWYSRHTISAHAEALLRLARPNLEPQQDKAWDVE